MFEIKNIPLANKGFFINLPASTDRLSSISKQIEKYEIKNLHRFEALTDDFIQFSCTKSHLKVFEESLKENLEIIFVSEDDFQIEDYCFQPNKNTSFDEVLKNVSDDLKNVEWDVVLFGCNPKSTVIPVTNNLGIVDKSTGAWAYIIKQRAYKYILENSNYKKDYIAIDDFLPLLNSKGFRTLTTIPMMINHGVGFVSTLQPKGPVNYNVWIQGNYMKFLYDNYKDNNFVVNRIEKEITVCITGHICDNYLLYLKYLLHSIPEELKKCKFIVRYDTNNLGEMNNVRAFFRDNYADLNVTISNGFGGLISSIKYLNENVRTKYYILLEHDWVFLNKKLINFNSLINAFNKHEFINAVWFSKDDNILRGFEIETDVTGKSTPFELENRVKEVNLVTTCRWSNNPVMFRTSKIIEWFNKIINNQYVGINHQGCHNVEETMIPYYRNIIKNNKWDDIRDDWGTFLYGNLNEGPYVGHTDASRRYQGHNKSQPEINGENYMRNNPL